MKDLYTLQCGTCGVYHAIPTAMHATCLEEGGFWFCPNGHKRGYREGQKQRDELRQERDRLKQQQAMMEDEIARMKSEAERHKKSATAYKGAATRMKNRAKAGVCPCCNRTFTNLARHMRSQHPDTDLDTMIELGQPPQEAPND